jgi:uncharacterized protein (TIGR02271 family)
VSGYTMDEVSRMRGANVYSSDDEKIGSVDEIYYDPDSGRPEWIGIGTGFFGTKRVLVPVEGARHEGDRFTVPYAKDFVKDSPDIESETIGQELEGRLYSYYGLGYSERRSATGLPEDAASLDVTSRTTDEGDMIRSEEELRVGTRDVEAGNVRLRKWVETEPVETDVALRRETARVTREPIDQPVGDADFDEEEIEIALHREEPVVEKMAVAKERLHIEKDVETEHETVRGDVRKERVEVEGEDERLSR